MTTVELEVREIAGKLNVSHDEMEANLRANMALGIESLKLRRVCLVGSGPSLAAHVDDIRSLQADGYDVFAMNNSAIFLLQNGITPDWHIIYDARACNADFITCPSARGYMIASHAHPDVIHTALDSGVPVRIFHAFAAAHLPHLVRELDPAAHILGSGITVGLQALNIAACEGYRVIRLYGYDSSYHDGNSHVCPQPINSGDRSIHVNHRGVKYVTSGAMAAQAAEFMACYQIYERLGMKVAVIGDGLLPSMWRAQEAKRKDGADVSLEEREAEKYRIMWANDAYRRWSPGAELLDTFIRECSLMSGGAFITDFGCGSGRAAMALHERGFDVLCIDHASNCLDPDVTLPLHVANLWQLGDIRKSDWGFCADVMEHIPPEKVDAVLASIAGAVRHGCFFSISFVPDGFGATIGQPLHLTVQNAEWWQAKLSQHFVPSRMLNHSANGGVFICTKKELP